MIKIIPTGDSVSVIDDQTGEVLFSGTHEKACEFLNRRLRPERPVIRQYTEEDYEEML